MLVSDNSSLLEHSEGQPRRLFHEKTRDRSNPNHWGAEVAEGVAFASPPRLCIGQKDVAKDIRSQILSRGGASTPETASAQPPGRAVNP